MDGGGIDMSIYYIQDADGRVVAQFDGRLRDTKEGHERIVVDSIEELPGVDEWDSNYEQ